jgi:hypothetical protein
MTNWKYCTPEQGKRLVELGIDGMIAERFYTPVFDCAELGVLLPGDMKVFRGGISDEWFIDCFPMDGYATQAEVMAATLIFLLTNKETTAAECNARLKKMNDE